MIGPWRLLRALLAWIAIAAYAAPVAVHASPRHHQPALAGNASEPCPHHADARAHDHHGHAGADDMHAKTPDAAPSCPGHGDGSGACCVAMCHPALPFASLAAAWVLTQRAASDGRHADRMLPGFVVRLDRPPKPGGTLRG
jgi:hypothetical protein